MVDIVPTTQGQDLTSRYQSHDAHIRLESRHYPSSGPAAAHDETEICVDVFDSSVADPSAAHVASDCFPWGNGGAIRATEFLRDWGFDQTVRFA